MRRLITWLIMVPTAVGVVVFALHNKAPVALDLWPFAMVVEVELYLLLTSILGAGVVLGGIASWAGGGQLRAQLRKRTYDGEVARRQLNAEREKTAELEVKLRACEMQNLNTTTSSVDGTVKTLEHGGGDAAQLPKPKTAA